MEPHILSIGFTLFTAVLAVVIIAKERAKLEVEREEMQRNIWSKNLELSNQDMQIAHQTGIIKRQAEKIASLQATLANERPGGVQTDSIKPLPLHEPFKRDPKY